MRICGIQEWRSLSAPAVSGLSVATRILRSEAGGLKDQLLESGECI